MRATRMFRPAFVAFLIAGAALAKPTAAAEPLGTDACTLDVEALNTPFISKGNRFETLRRHAAKATPMEKRKLTHAIRLPSGVEVAYSAGGYEHYAYDFTVSRLAHPPVLGQPDAFNIVRTEIRRFPISSDQRSELLKMVDALEKTSTQRELGGNPELEAPFGDATVGLKVSKDGFTLSYDFLL